MDFESLVGRINQVQDVLQAQAAHAINLALTARNWLVGYYIVEFEQNGEDRAKYGENLLNRLSKNINRKGFEPRSLRLYRRFYLVYLQLGAEVGSYIQKNSSLTSNSGVHSIWQAAPAKFQTSENQGKGRPVKHPSPKMGEPHYHPTDRNGLKKPNSPHHGF